MSITRTERNEIHTASGKLVDEEEVEVDVTEEHNASVIDRAISDALAELRALVAYPAVPDVPSGTLTTAQLSNVVRAMRDEMQKNRAGAQRVADILIKTIRLVRGDFDDID